MYLLPIPNKLEEKQGNFLLNDNSRIILSASSNSSDLRAGIVLKEEITKLTALEIQISKAFEAEEGSIFIKKDYNKKEGYILNITDKYIEINGGDDAGVFYGIMTLCQILRQDGLELPCLYIEDEPYFKNRGYYHDVTRGKVPTLETLKELVDTLSEYKINHLQLYIEHTFAFKEFSEVWTGKDPLTAEEILLLDEYCKERHIELVPSIATFGHLYHVLSSATYSELCELENSSGKPFSWMDRMSHHTLDVSNEGSVKLIEYMMKEFIPLFSSKKFNICCDETFDLGKGKNKEKADSLGSGRLYVDFLNKVIGCVKSYGKEVMFWGDIILHHPELLEEIPQDVTCLNWYYWLEPKEEDTKTIKESGLSQYMCPGVSGWNRFMNDIETSFINISKMTALGKKYGAVGILNTDWGDFGHINLLGNSMPGMIYGAALSWNPDNIPDNDSMERIISKVHYGDISERIVSLLRKLSKAEKASWWNINAWIDSTKQEDEEVKQKGRDFINYDNKLLEEGYFSAVDMRREFHRYSTLVNRELCKDVKEFIVSAKAIELMNAFVLTLKKYDLKDESVNVVMNNSSIASQLEYWLADYEKVWRERNKESELYRIRETIIYIADYLRNIK